MEIKQTSKIWKYFVPKDTPNLWKYLVPKQSHIRKNIITKVILDEKGNLNIGIF
jgi:hypothetical protein